MTDSSTDRFASRRSTPALWSTGILGTDATLVSQAVDGLAHPRMREVRLFVDCDTVVPDRCAHVPISVLSKHLSPQAIERFLIAELVMRTPSATAILLVTDRADCRDLQRWCDRLQQILTETDQPSLFVDAMTKPGIYALTTDSARAYLADHEGLCDSLQPTSSPHVLGDALSQWASRTGVSVTEVTVSKSESALPDGVARQLDQGPNVQSIHVSGAIVSIVVPSWNCADYLSDCLNSLLRQTVAAEVIVVDDASSDYTNRVLDSFGDRITVVRHARQRGANAARNTGIAAASGDLIAFADADNEYAACWIEQLQRALLGDPTAALAYCGYTKQSSDAARVENRAASWDLDTLWFGNYIDMSSIVRRSALPADGLHEGFRPFDDWRLWLNLAQRGWRGVWVAEELFVKHVRDAGKTEQSMADPHQRGREITEVRREFAGLVGLEKPISVVIPASGCEDLTACCLAHLSDYCGVPFFVVYVDNGSPVETLDSVARSADAAGISLRIIRNLENRGFTDAINQGIEASGDSDVLVLNNDCFIGPGCVENLARELRFNDRVAAAGPLTGDDGKQSLKVDQRRALLQLPDDILDDLDDPVRMSFRMSQRSRSVAEPVLSFYCALLSNDALARYGALDPRFASGLGADDEWCFRVRDHGREVRVVLNAYAAHLHRSSFKRLDIDRDSLQQDAQALLHRVLATERDDK